MDLISYCYMFQAPKILNSMAIMLWITCSFLLIASSFGDDRVPAPSDGMKQDFHGNGTEFHALISGEYVSNDYPRNISTNTHAVSDRFYQFYLRSYIRENYLIDIQTNYGITHIPEKAFLWTIDLEASGFYWYCFWFQPIDFTLGYE